jgi:hypothetical protein
MVRIGLDLDRKRPLLPGRIEHLKFVNSGIHGHVESLVLDIHSTTSRLILKVLLIALNLNSARAAPVLLTPLSVPERATPLHLTTSTTGSVALAINTFRSSRMCLRRRILAACWRPNLAL